MTFFCLENQVVAATDPGEKGNIKLLSGAGKLTKFPARKSTPITPRHQKEQMI